MSTIYICLNKNIEINSLLNKIQNMLQKYGNTSESVMKIEILKVAQENNGLIPKIEYEGDIM